MRTTPGQSEGSGLHKSFPPVARIVPSCKSVFPHLGKRLGCEGVYLTFHRPYPIAELRNSRKTNFMREGTRAREQASLAQVPSVINNKANFMRRAPRPKVPCVLRMCMQHWLQYKGSEIQSLVIYFKVNKFTFSEPLCGGCLPSAGLQWNRKT